MSDSNAHQSLQNANSTGKIFFCQAIPKRFTLVKLRSFATVDHPNFIFLGDQLPGRSIHTVFL